eukprot:3815934-Rhodomonas_salina.1
MEDDGEEGGVERGRGPVEDGCSAAMGDGQQALTPAKIAGSWIRPGLAKERNGVKEESERKGERETERQRLADRQVCRVGRREGGRER